MALSQEELTKMVTGEGVIAQALKGEKYLLVVVQPPAESDRAVQKVIITQEGLNDMELMGLSYRLKNFILRGERI